MDEIINNLCNLYFSKIEAKIYVTLIKLGDLSGYQIAKNIGIARTSVYSALDGMYEKGIVLKINESEGTKIYQAQNPVTLFEALRSKYNQNAIRAEEVLKKYYEQDFKEKFVNIEGYETVISKAKEMMKNSNKEICINSDFDIQIFKDEIIELRKRGVRVIVFSFARLNCEGLDIEYYSRNECSADNPTRLMLVSDCKDTLVADTYKARGTWLGTITNNALLTSIVNEHILNDIYIQMVEKKNGEFIEDRMKLNTLIEQRCSNK